MRQILKVVILAGVSFSSSTSCRLGVVIEGDCSVDPGERLLPSSYATPILLPATCADLNRNPPSNEVINSVSPENLDKLTVCGECLNHFVGVGKEEDVTMEDFNTPCVNECEVVEKKYFAAKKNVKDAHASFVKSKKDLINAAESYAAYLLNQDMFQYEDDEPWWLKGGRRLDYDDPKQMYDSIENSAVHKMYVYNKAVEKVKKLVGVYRVVCTKIKWTDWGKRLYHLQTKYLRSKKPNFLKALGDEGEEFDIQDYADKCTSARNSYESALKARYLAKGTFSLARDGYVSATVQYTKSLYSRRLSDFLLDHYSDQYQSERDTFLGAAEAVKTAWGPYTSACSSYCHVLLSWVGSSNEKICQGGRLNGKISRI